MWIKPGAYNPHPVDKKVRAMMYTIEEAIESMEKSKGVEKMMWMLDFSGSVIRVMAPIVGF
jgi:hypothetical protein